MLNGALIGAAAGFVGGGVGSAIGGGWGALVGGAASNITGQLLSTGDVNWSQVGLSAGLSFGMYHAMSSASWKWGGGNNIGNHDISYRQFTTMQADFQRSRFWNKEYGGWLNNDGSVIRWHHSTRGTYGISPPSSILDNAFASYHTHWAKPGINVAINPITGDKTSDMDILSKNVRVTQTMRYHSSFDLDFDASVGLDSYVLNRYDYSYNGVGAGVWHDPFIRFFMFPNWW